MLYAFLFLTTLQVIKADLLPKNGECGLNPNDNFLGGSGVQINDYPWTVRLQYEKDNQKRFLCGGVLINNRYIITQGYCTKPIGSWKLTGVSVGQSNSTINLAVIVEIEDALLHENYNNKNVVPDNDIAMVRLKIKLDFNDLTRPICIPRSQKDKTNSFNGQELVTTGYGKSYDDDKIDIRKQYVLTGLDDSECTKAYKEKQDIVVGEGKLCASGVNTFCAGSAGNPLMVQKDNAWMLVGIESTGTPCRAEPHNRLPTIYTMVGYHTDWILKNLKP